MDDIVLYTVLATAVAIILGTVLFLQRNKDSGKPTARRGPPRLADGAGAEGGARNAQGPPNRVAANRNARARMRAAAARRDDSDEEEDPVAALGEDVALPDGKLGKKKLAKLQAKADKRSMREAEERDREYQKERAEKKAEEKRLEEEKREEEEEVRNEELKKEEEERARKEQEEYELLKASFAVEDEGFDVADNDQKTADLLSEFVDFIKTQKVVVLEDLAARFKLKTQAVIDRVNELQAQGTLTGVIDDRGKFIYISQDELESVAKFIRQRGRVSLAELAENSNTLITLKS